MPREVTTVYDFGNGCHYSLSMVLIKGRKQGGTGKQVGDCRVPFLYPPAPLSYLPLLVAN